MKLFFFSSFILTNDITVQLLASVVAEKEGEGVFEPRLLGVHLCKLKKKTKNCQVQNPQQYGAASQSSSTFFIAILCCFINIIKHFYMYTFFFS